MRVLLIPESYPRNARDIAGIFAKDYVRAVASEFVVDLLVISIHAKAGLRAGTTSIAGERQWTYGPSGIQRLLPGRLRRLWTLKTIVNRLSDLPQVDLIHAHGPVYWGFSAMQLGKKRGIPTVVTVHTGPFQKLMRHSLVKRMTHETLENVDCVLPVSNDLQQQIEQFGIHPQRCEVHYNPVDTQTFALGPAERQKLIAWAGRLEEYKGGLRSVQAFQTIAAEYPEWKLALAGEGPQQEQIRQYLSQHNLEQRVSLLGMQTKAEIAALFARSSFGVFPTEHETFGLVLVEAMAAGLPIIGPNCSAPVEYLNPTNSLAVSPTDIPGIANAMRRMIVDGARYDRQAIRHQVVSRFGLEAFGNRMAELYHDLCKKKRA